jgi:hypothetical protein
MNSLRGHMNTRMLLGWLPGMVLAGGLATSGFAQENPNPYSALGSTAAAAPLPPAQTLKVELSAGALDVEKLTQAGVGENVILAYVTNSTAFYNLTPDRIIQLKNVGASAKVIAAMISHDQQLPADAPLPIAPAAPPQTLAMVIPEDETSHIIANDDTWLTPSIIADDEGYAPEQPADLGPVRAPYPVRLSDPIVIMKLPSFTIPYW